MNQQMGMILYLVVFIAIFYFLLIRPQSKARKARGAMMEALKVGDKIYTAGGFVGTIKKLHDDSVTLKLAEGVEVELLRTGIGGLKQEANQ